MRARSSLLFLAPTLLLAVACKSHDGGERGMPPASAWKAPEATLSDVEAGQGARVPTDGDAGARDPHAGLDMGGAGDPHAGLDMGGAGDPHAGRDMGGAGDPHAGLDMGGAGAMDPAMANLQPPDPDRPIDPSKVVRGTIRADAGLAERIAAGSILFLTAWPIDPATEEVIGSPVAVARLTVDKLPIEFELSERDGMVDGTRFDGVVMVDARVDTDGDGEARTRGPDDLAGRVRARVPATELELVLRPR